MKRGIAICLFLLLCLPAIAYGETDIYTLLDEEGTILARYCGVCEAGDEYISRSNQHYRVIKTDPVSKTAVAEWLGAAAMPDVSWIEMEHSQPVSAIGERKIALYCTHSDESYIEGDGTESVEGAGGIYDIG